jgi:hypothetical protein
MEYDSSCVDMFTIEDQSINGNSDCDCDHSSVLDIEDRKFGHFNTVSKGVNTYTQVK